MTYHNKNEIIPQILSFAKNPLNIREENFNCHFLHTLKICLEAQSRENLENQDYLFQIDAILDYIHEELNTGHWSTVPLTMRENFTVSSYIKAVLMLKNPNELTVDSLEHCLKVIDLGLLLGAPLEENPELLMECAKYLQKEINKYHRDTLINVENKTQYEDHLHYYSNIDAIEIEALIIPSIETFNNKFFQLQIPVILKGCMDHWPASKKWLDVNYLLEVAGNRTVPVELGSLYTDEQWSQKLMTLKDFIKNHYLSESGNTGYLAQHNLFDQISELREDIRIPEYCCCSLNFEEAMEPDINAWLGPKGTVSPLHQDPKNNVLAQVYGTKQILLYSPEDTQFLYPHGETMLSNTSQVDPLNPNYIKYPEFKKATMFKGLLKSGEMLFIPLKWWHHVTALEKSFSVSFWWQ
ncbi:hypothetical protein ABEB36_000735 [Hypothenemus hampei]|uniref:JmjC domain-containing protein n=1 Tax=Hypothenemus hampei TaxID=57062 RepID=A0ABD1FC88_HYPHA